MKEITGNIFDCYDADAICVTTNGVVKSNGELVMGAGIAKQFADRYPELAMELGKGVRRLGNIVQLIVLGYYGPDCPEGHNAWIISFPTKYHWKDPSDLELIRRSAQDLVKIADRVNVFPSTKQKKIVLPRPGTGLGGLKWEDVKKVIEPILDDRFYIITPK